MRFGDELRRLRRERGLTLRVLADRVGVSFTYLSKIENSRVPYTPAPETIRNLASALGVDSLGLLEAAGKVPPELAHVHADADARRFFERAQTMASPEDWAALLEVLEQRRAQRQAKDKSE